MVVNVYCGFFADRT